MEFLTQIVLGYGGKFVNLAIIDSDLLMAVINDLVGQIENQELRARIQKEVEKLQKQKKFGLVFEEHLPECTPLYDIPVKRGSTVALKSGKVSENYRVISIDGDNAVCERVDNRERSTYPLADLVVVAQFGEAIYPYLKPIDFICNAPDSDLWHTLIEADNYHALQLLEYLYAGKVDCIYIDPPYNTGARDWKYNNDYVDNADSYRHSKWLSMMQKRLKLAKKLLNPKDSVLIVTIDEKEYLHLGCLLEEMFPEASLQMVSSVINPAGVTRANQFSRTNEYIFIISLGTNAPFPQELDGAWIGEIKNIARKNGLRWNTLLRSGSHVLRSDSPNQFYPIFVSQDGKRIVSVGEPYYGTNRAEIVAPEGCIAIWPIRQNGDEGNWQVSRTSLLDLKEKGYLRLGRFNERGTIAIDYLKRGEIEKVESGVFKITGYNEAGFIIVDDSEYRPKFVPGCQWNIPLHDATQNGKKLLTKFLPETGFAYPKSLYAVADVLNFYISGKKNSLILDFFAGSGTTLHAVNLLNAVDGGHRRCILVTNNEVSDAEAKSLTAQGFRPGDREWNELGIARSVTWPRTVHSILGKDTHGNLVEGEYSGYDLKMGDGFKANVVFYQLGFLDKNAVALGRQFKELLPLLWLKSGAFSKCPQIDEVPKMLMLPDNKFAVLVDETYFAEFEGEILNHPEIQTVYIVTDSEAGYREMIAAFPGKDTYQLYRDYLDNFRINNRR